jgi:Protein of unknown function (DUF4231)
MDGEDRAVVTDGIPSPASSGAAITRERLEDQLRWYDRKSQSAQHAYKRVKVLQLVLAAGVPVAVASDAPGVLTAVLGGLVVVLEKYLFMAGAGPYSGPDRERVLAERIEGLVSQEHAKWTEGRHQATTDVEPPSHRGPSRAG